MSAVFRYKRVTVSEGKHGPGDFRVEFNGRAPTHGEVIAMVGWLFRAEDRYTRGHGRRLLWWLVKEVYNNDGMSLRDAIENADGPYDWDRDGVFE